MPKFSVIVPAYNVETYLDRCVTSILHQTCTDFELIIIDDGSTDGTGKMLDEYALADERIRVVHSHNQGQSAARNIGLDLCAGKYVYFCDSDDWIEPDLLERCLECIEREHTDIVKFQSFTHIGEETRASAFDLPGENVHYEAPSEKISFICDVILRYQIGWELWLGVYKNEVLQKNKIRFPAGIDIAEDLYFLILNVYCGQSCAFIDEPFYHYCLRDDSTMGQVRGDMRLDETNDLTYQLYLNTKEPILKDKFYLIHNMMVFNAIGVYVPRLSRYEAAKDFSQTVSDITKREFFLEQTKKAYKQLKHYYVKNLGFFNGRKRNNLNRFIIDHNYCLYRFNWIILEIIFVPVRIIRKIGRMLKIGK